MSKTNYPSKADKAQALIDAGHVRLFPGRGYATVIGSTGSTYTIRKGQGCECPDHQYRGVDCAHMIAARQLCGLYRELAKAARAGQKVRIPVELVYALGGVAPDPPPTVPVPAGALVDERGIPYCHSCGADLIDGYCPREAAERRSAA